MSITVLLVDEHTFIRKGIRACIAENSAYRVIGEASSAATALADLQRLQPDIVIMDITLPDIPGLFLIGKIKEYSPHTRVVIMTDHASEQQVQAALRAGVNAYLLKVDEPGVLIQALQQVMDGKPFLSPLFIERAIHRLVAEEDLAGVDPLNPLTRREREIFHLTINGYANTEISERLSISIRTVEVHLNNIMRKLDIHSHRELVRFAVEKGFLHSHSHP